MIKYFDVLRRCSLFEGISDSDLMPMMKCMGGSVKRFDKRENIFTEGEAAKCVGIMLSGGAQLVQVDYYGNRSILSEAGQGEVFAEAFACAEVRALPISAIANEPCDIMLINCDHILHTCHNGCGFHQQLIYNLMKDLASKTILFLQRIEVTAKRTTREKLMTFLALQARKAGSNAFTIPFDRQELADYLEVDRSGLSAEISKLQREGVLVSQKNRFTLL